VFPSSSRQGHFNKDTAKGQHSKAIQSANIKAKQNGGKQLKQFEPYVLRHTALTQLAQAGVDVFTQARIAGHSSDAIERAFAPFGSTNINSLTAGENSQVGTNLGKSEESKIADSLQAIGAKGGTRTPTPCGARS
jgi:hypothetical protein